MNSKTQIAGILMIISGVVGVLWLGAAFFGIYMGHVLFRSPFYGPMPPEFDAFMAFIYIGQGIFGALLGILALIGGALALKKKHWGWSLAGSIAGVITFFPTGVAGIILLSMGREEFSPPSPPGQPSVIGGP